MVQQNIVHAVCLYAVFVHVDSARFSHQINGIKGLMS